MRHHQVKEYPLEKLLLSFAILLGLSACSTTGVKQPAIASTHWNLEKIESDGRSLYTAMQSSDVTDPLTSRETDLLQMAADKLLCDGDYQAVRVADEQAQIEHIYLILQPEKSKGVQFGRHVRFDFKLGTNDLEKIEISTKTCLLVPLDESSDEAAFITHLLSETPTDFHVYLSLHHQKVIFVSTSAGLWKIENGHISKTE